jgi:serine/tyrosine/threonine adenylyltransferase
VKRDPLYNGNIKLERAAIVLRMCESFLRFGSLQVCLPEGQMHQPSPLENRKLLQPICDFAIQQHFPDINPDEEDPYE